MGFTSFNLSCLLRSIQRTLLGLYFMDVLPMTPSVTSGPRAQRPADRANAAHFNTSSDAYCLTLVFHQMPDQLPYLVTAQAADIFSSTAVTKTLLASSELLLTPAVVTATTPGGRVVTHTHTLTNASSTTQVYTLTARSAQSWAVTTDPSSVTLPSGAAITFTTSISIPDDSYVTTGAMDCIVVEILPSRIYSYVREVYLPLILWN
jgi:hypothetical protein